MSNTSSIDDLPSDPTVSQFTQQNVINVEDKNARIPVTAKPYNPNEFSKEIEQLSAGGYGTLPSRDIPSNTQSHIAVDEVAKPNHIPEIKMAKNNLDYISETERFSAFEQTYKQKRDLKRDSLDILLEELKIPIFVALFYFISQQPMLKQLLRKNMPFGFFGDGNFNLIGYVITSILFGMGYYTLTKAMEKLEI